MYENADPFIAQIDGTKKIKKISNNIHVSTLYELSLIRDVMSLFYLINMSIYYGVKDTKLKKFISCASLNLEIDSKSVVCIITDV